MKRTVEVQLCKAEDLMQGDVFIYDGDIYSVLDFEFSIACIDVTVYVPENGSNCGHDNIIRDVIHLPKLCDVEVITRLG